MLKLILLSYNRVKIGRFYESCGNRQKWLQQYLSLRRKKLQIVLIYQFHKLRCHMLHNYCYYTISVLVKVLKVLVNNREIRLCIPKQR